MRIRVSSLLPLLLMLLLAGLSLWLRIAVEVPSGDAPYRRHDPDSIIENFTLKRLDERGLPGYALAATRMTHYADDDSTELISPRLVRRADGLAITITAERGTVTKDGAEAFFEGNVLIVRERGNQRPELRVRTDALQIMADQNVARTDRRVIITEGRTTLTGVGMELEQEARRFTLFSQVRGSIEPARN